MPPSEHGTLNSSPERSLTNLLRRSSRKDSKRSSSISIASEDGASHEQSRFKMSLDRLREKTTRSSHDVERSSSQDSGRFKKLIRSGSRRKGHSVEPEQSPDVAGGLLGRRGRKLRAAQRLGVQDHDSRLHVGASAESLGLSPSGASSLLTEDSDPDLPTEHPSLAPNHSHEDLLTFTSPLIEAETLPSPSHTSHSPSIAPHTPHTHSLADPTAASDATPGDASFFPSLITTTSPSETVLRGETTHPTLSLNDGLERVEVDPHKPNASSPASFSQFFKKAGTWTKRDTAAFDRPKNISPRPASAGLSLKPSPATPSTFVTPPTPTLPHSRSPSPTKNKSNLTLGPLPTPPRVSATPSERGVVHRRARSATAASTASIKLAPLTPHIEEASTPGGTVISPSGSSGFFASFWSSTHNAVTSISNSINQSSSSSVRKRSDTVSSDPKEPLSGSTDEEVILTNPRAHPNIVEVEGEPREPAVRTLGSGNLSLSHLGFGDEGMASKPEFSDGLVASPSSTFRAMQNDEVAAAHDALTSAHDKPSTPVVNDTAPTSRPRSINSAINSLPGDSSPPRTGGLYEPERGLARTGSTRSRLSGKRRAKRSRNSSTATGSAIAAALASSHSALAHPGANGSTSQIQGFAVASSKRNKDFHALFKSVPEDDYLIEDYSAALQRDILLHGRLYVSEKHICFSSNILGWVTNLVMSFDEIVSMEKKSTALIFPNALIIQTLHAKNVFASFLNRDQTYDLLIGIWKIGHPNLKTSENGHVLDEEQKAELAESIGDEEDSDDDEDYSGDDFSSRAGGSMMDIASSVPPSEVGDAPRMVSHKASGSGPAALGDPSSKIREATPGGAAAALGEFPGPKEHGPTEAPAEVQPFEKQVPEGVIPAPLGKVYSMMFGPESGVTMTKFLTDDQQCRELQMEDDKKGMGEENKQFSYSYIRPLNAPVGPKQTKCNVNQTLDVFDLNKAVVVTCSTQTPDVPSGNSFVVKTKYILTWGLNNSTKFQMSFTVEWSAKSWLKGPIEKGSNDGQMSYGRDIAAFFKNAVASRGGARAPKGGKVKGKKRRSPTGGAESEPKRSQDRDAKKGGLLAPIMGVLGPVGDILEPLVSTTSILAVLLVIVTALWLRSGGRQHTALRDPLMQHASRMAAYDELWRREEMQLWDWLEDRIELDEVALRGRSKQPDEAAVLTADIPVKLAEQRMGDQQMEDAIRVTEERLATLKAAHGRKKH